LVCHFGGGHPCISHQSFLLASCLRSLLSFSSQWFCSIDGDHLGLHQAHPLRHEHRSDDLGEGPGGRGKLDKSLYVLLAAALSLSICRPSFGLGSVADSPWTRGDVEDAPVQRQQTLKMCVIVILIILWNINTKRFMSSRRRAGLLLLLRGALFLPVRDLSEGGFQCLHRRQCTYLHRHIATRLSSLILALYNRV
jgi:hypothetical protein